MKKKKEVDLKDIAPSKDQKICHNCKHMLWMVGIGQGVKCGLNLKAIPNKWYTCNNFENKYI